MKNIKNLYKGNQNSPFKQNTRYSEIVNQIQNKKRIKKQ